MEAVYSFETWVYTQNATQRNNPDHTAVKTSDPIYV
jgi:hypothetical protein